MKMKILVVDDNPSIGIAINEALEDYDVDMVYSGEEALSYLDRNEDVDMAIVDVVMPGISGIELLKRIREKSTDMFVVIMTAYESKDVLVDALRANADDYLEKPIDFEKLDDVMTRLFCSCGKPVFELPSAMKSKVEWIKKYIRQNYHKPGILEDTAEQLCLTPKHLGRMFKEEVGMGFTEYRLIVRMDAAKKLIRRKGMSISEIAYHLGYKNQESFCKAFRKYVGSSPSEYKTIANKKITLADSR